MRKIYSLAALVLGLFALPAMAQLAPTHQLFNATIVFEDGSTKPTKLASNRVRDVALASDGKKIIAYDNAGVGIYDGSKVTTLKYDGKSILAGSVHTDKTGITWIGAWDAIYKYDKGVVLPVMGDWSGAYEIEESPAGDIWMAACKKDKGSTLSQGLIKFVDGKGQRFHKDNSGLTANRCFRIAPDGDGGVWYATNAKGRGVAHFDGTTQQHFHKESVTFPTPTKLTSAIAVHKGQVYVAFKGNLYKKGDSQWERVKVGTAKGSYEIYNLTSIADELWVSSTQGAVKWNPSTNEEYRLTSKTTMLESNVVADVVENADGTKTIVTGYYNYDISVALGLGASEELSEPKNYKGFVIYKQQQFAFDGGEIWSKDNGSGFLHSYEKMYPISNEVFALPYWRKVNLINPKTRSIKTLEVEKGFISNVASTKSGIYLSTQRGLYMVKGNVTEMVPLDAKGISPNISAVDEDANGNLWIAHQKGIAVRKGGMITVYTKKDFEMPGKYARSVRAFGDKVYVGFGRGIGEFDIKTNKWKVYSGKAGNFEKPVGAVFDIEVGTDGTVWAVSFADLVKLENGKFVDVKLDGKTIKAKNIDIGPNGEVWVSGANGLYTFANGKWEHKNVDNSELVFPNVHGVLQVGETKVLFNKITPIPKPTLAAGETAPEPTYPEKLVKRYRSVSPSGLLYFYK